MIRGSGDEQEKWELKMKTIDYVLKAPLSKNYKIALLADMHSKVNPHILPTLQSNNPDIICIAGDLCNTSLSDSPKVEVFLNEIVGLAPTFFSLGNHDYLLCRQDIEEIKEIGVTVLNDFFVRFNEEIVIGDMTLYFYHKCEKFEPKIPMVLFPEVTWLDEFEKQEGYKILLDHHPDNYEPYTKNRNIDLILSGHAHGGQIRMFGKGLYGKSQGFLPKYDGGVFDQKLVISRGLANTLPIPRLWNPTEIVFLEIKGEK